MASGDPLDFYASAGENWPKKLTAFAKFVRRDSVVTTGDGLRIHQTLKGKSIRQIPRPAVFRGSFSVALTSATEVVIGAGLVNGMTPTIGGNRIDGVDAEGKPLDEGRPKLSLSGAGPSLRSLVALRVEIDVATGEMNPESEDAVTVVDLPGFAPGATAGGWPDDGAGVGYHPIAEIVWLNEKTPQQVRQIVYFDQVHRYIESDGAGEGRHFFSPAA